MRAARFQARPAHRAAPALLVAVIGCVAAALAAAAALSAVSAHSPFRTSTTKNERGDDVTTYELGTILATKVANVAKDAALSRRHLQAGPATCAGSSDPWCIVNYYFQHPSVGYVGVDPGPCPGFWPGKCEGWACMMSETFKTTPVLGGYTVEQLILCDDCTREGRVALQELSFGALVVGNIVLTVGNAYPITPTPANPIPQFAPCPTSLPTTSPICASTLPGMTLAPTGKYQGNNAMALTLQVTQLTFQLNLKANIYNMYTAQFSVIGIHFCPCHIPTLGYNSGSDPVAVSVAPGGNGVFLQLEMFLFSNIQCSSFVNPTTGHNGACIFDPEFYYATGVGGSQGAPNTETFAQGIVYSMNFPTTDGTGLGPTYDKASACSWTVNGQKSNFGISVDVASSILPSWASWIPGLADFINTAVDWIIALVIESILCDLIINSAYAENGNAQIFYDQPGVFNNGLNIVYNWLRTQVSYGLIPASNNTWNENTYVPNYFFSQGWPQSSWVAVNPQWRPFPGAVDFNNSAVFKAVSLGLNALLGSNASSTPGYEDKLVIVEVIDILTGNTQGIVPLGRCTGYDPTCVAGYCPGPCYNDIKSQLNLKAYPSIAWGNGTYVIPKTSSPSAQGDGTPDIWYPAKMHDQESAGGLPMFDGMIQLNGMELFGVNSITQFNILDNGFGAKPPIPMYTHTVHNSFAMSNITVVASMSMFLYDGYWMHRPNAATWPGSSLPHNGYYGYHPSVRGSMEIDFTFEISLLNIALVADLMLLIIPGNLGNYHVGQVLGQGILLSDRVSCLSYGLDWAQVTRFQVTGTLSSLVLNNFFGSGVGGLISQGTKVVQQGYTAGTALYLKYITDNEIKHIMNDFLLDKTFVGPYNHQHANGYCVPTYNYYYTTARGNYASRYVSFTDSHVWYFVRGAVQNLVGGQPVRTGDASINTIIQFYLQWYTPNLNTVTIVPRCDYGSEPWYSSAPFYTPNSYPCQGNWDVLDGSVTIRASNTTENFVQFTNLKIRNLDSIHELWVNPLGDHTLQIAFVMGDGLIYDRYAQPNPAYYNPGYFILAFDVSTNVVIKRPGDSRTWSYAEDSATFALGFGNLSFSLNLYLLINQNTALDLKFSDLTHLACMLSTLDATNMSNFNIGFYAFNLSVNHFVSSRSNCYSATYPTKYKTWQPSWRFNMSANGVCGVDDHRILHFSDAIDYLAWEAPQWGAKVKDMLLYVFSKLSADLQDIYNVAPIKGGSVSGCSSRSVFGSNAAVHFLEGLLSNATNLTKVNNAYTSITLYQPNPVYPLYAPPFPAVPQYDTQPNCRSPTGAPTTFPCNSYWGWPATKGPANPTCASKYAGNNAGACWEDVPTTDASAINVDDNFIVASLQTFLSTKTAVIVNAFLHDLSQVSPLVKVYHNNTALPGNRGTCITGGANQFWCADIEIDDLAHFIGLNISHTSNGAIVPGFGIYPRKLVVQRIDSLDITKLQVLEPYVRDLSTGVDADARFTLRHRVYFDTLTIHLEVDVTVDRQFVYGVNDPHPFAALTDTFALDVAFTDFDLQLLTMTAINSTRLHVIPLSNLFNPLHNTPCFYSMFYLDGLSLPQLQLYVSDVANPFTSDGSGLSLQVYPYGGVEGQAANIFSGAMTYLISASIELGFELLRDDLPNAFQGPVRDKVNNLLQQLVLEAHQDNTGGGTDVCFQGSAPSLCDWGLSQLQGLTTTEQSYVNFLSNCVTKALNFTNTYFGGVPITSSNLDINHAINYTLQYFLETKPSIKSTVVTMDPAYPLDGQLIPNALFYQTGMSFINISNVGISGIPSIYNLWVHNYPKGVYPQNLFQVGVDLALGNGTYYDHIDNDPAYRAVTEPLTIHIDFASLVKVNRPGNVIATIADDQFRVTIQLSQIAISTMMQLYVDRLQLSGLTLDQLISVHCYRAVIHGFLLDSLNVTLGDLQVYIPDFGSGPGRFGHGSGNLGQAIGALRQEANITNQYYPPQQSKPTHMVNVMLRNIGQTVADIISGADYFGQQIEACENPVQHFTVVAGLKNNSATIHTLLTGLPLLVPQIVVTSDGLVGPTLSADLQDLRLVYEHGTDQTTFVNDVIAAALLLNTTQRIVLKAGNPCADLNLGTAATQACSLFSGTSGKNLSSAWAEFTAPQSNPIDEKWDVSRIETGIYNADGTPINLNVDPIYDVQKSKIVTLVNNYFAAGVPTLRRIIQNSANYTSFLRLESDGTTTLDFNITELMLWVDAHVIKAPTCDGQPAPPPKFLFADLLETTNVLIPSMRILPGNLTIRNIDQFTTATVFKPYPNAHFTTENEFGFLDNAHPLEINVQLQMFYDAGFNEPGVSVPSGMTANETIDIALNITGLYIQTLFLLAVNPVTLGEISLANFLVVDAAQTFTRNCYAVGCLLASVYQGGMQVPQLTLNVTDIQGPVFTTTRNLFSQGFEMFVSAMLEIVVQVFRDDLSNIFQGPLRDLINTKLLTLQDNSVCPAKRNYALDYPLGEYYCSHNDSTGVSPVRTQTQAACEAKGLGNAQTCKYVNQDAVYSVNLTMCFYAEQAQDLDFSHNTELKHLSQYINSTLLNPSSGLYINRLLGSIMDPSHKTAWHYTNPPLALSYNGNNFGTVSLGIGRAQFQGWNTITALQVFDNSPWQPGGPSRYGGSSSAASGRRRLSADAVANFGVADNNYTTRTSVSISGLTDTTLNGAMISFELSMIFDGLFTATSSSAIANGATVVENDLKFQLFLADTNIALDLFMLVNIPRLMDLQVQSLSTIYQLPCILAIFEPQGLVPVGFNMTFGEVSFEVCCTGTCNSPLFSPLQNTCFAGSANYGLTEAVTRTFNLLVKLAVAYVSSTQAQAFLNTQIASAITQCKAIQSGLPSLPTASQPATIPAATYMGIAGLAAVFTSFVGFAFLVPVHFRRRDDLMKRALLDAHERGAAGKSKDEFELAERRLKSSFEHPVMPRWVKFGVPAAIIGNIIMFATANFAAPGAIVQLVIGFAGDTSEPITILPFSLKTSIDDMWNAGVYPLAIIIALASGAWPYTKNILLLFAWFAPATILHPNARSRLLLILDWAGKWSLIDIYVLVLLMVAFHFFLSSSMVSELGLLPANAITVNVTVQPGWGIFGFLFGAMGSLVVNHVMIWFHRECMRSDEDLQDAILGQLVKDLRTPRIPLMRHRFNILDAEGRPYRYSALVRVVYLVGFLIIFVLIIVGSVVLSINFSFYGVAGLAIAFIDPALASQSYSTTSIAMDILSSNTGTVASILSIVFLQIIYLMFALITPLLMCIIFCVIWAVPLTLQEQLLMSFAIEVVYAWEALAVLVFSLIAAVLQIQQLAQFIVNAATGQLCQLAHAPLAKIFPGNTADQQCFNVVASLLPTTTVIAIACVSLIVWSAVAWRLVDAALVDRENAMRRKQPVSPGDMTGLKGFVVRRALEAYGPAGIRVGADGDPMNMFAQAQGAFAQSTPNALSPMPSYMDGPAQASAYDAKMSREMGYANPVMARETVEAGYGSGGQGAQQQAVNPMFVAPGSSIGASGTRAPGASYGSARPGPSGHTSIDV